MKKEVRIGGKVDLDTVGVGFLLGVNREDNVVVLRNGQASEEELANPEIFCIEIGGSGRVMESNFDHHDPEGPKESATLQMLRELDWTIGDSERPFYWRLATYYWPLVNYIDLIDVRGPRCLPAYGQVEFPTLSDVFAGMCLITRDPVEQFHRGIEILSRVVSEGQDPFGTISGFPEYARAKVENNQQVAQAVQSAKWVTTAAGRKLGYLETDFFGAPGALYGKGAEVVVAFAPRFGNPPVPKFTIGGNGVRVDAVLPNLNKMEPGWGGPATGTVIGSPREGSSLSLEQVVTVVLKTL